MIDIPRSDEVKICGRIAGSLCDGAQRSYHACRRSGRGSDRYIRASGSHVNDGEAVLRGGRGSSGTTVAECLDGSHGILFAALERTLDRIRPYANILGRSMFCDSGCGSWWGLSDKIGDARGSGDGEVEDLEEDAEAIFARGDTEGHQMLQELLLGICFGCRLISGFSSIWRRAGRFGNGRYSEKEYVYRYGNCLARLAHVDVLYGTWYGTSVVFVPGGPWEILGTSDS